MKALHKKLLTKLFIKFPRVFPISKKTPETESSALKKFPILPISFVPYYKNFQYKFSFTFSIFFCSMEWNENKFIIFVLHIVSFPLYWKQNVFAFFRLDNSRGNKTFGWIKPAQIVWKFFTNYGLQWNNSGKVAVFNGKGSSIVVRECGRF